MIQRTTEDSNIHVPKGYVPDGLRPLLGDRPAPVPVFFRDGEVVIGPIPKGTPVSLLTSMDLTAPTCAGRSSARQHQKKLVDLFKQVKRGAEARQPTSFADRNIMEAMLSLSKCPDSWSTRATTSAPACSRRNRG